jgi:hypothetical protein
MAGISATCFSGNDEAEYPGNAIITEIFLIFVTPMPPTGG